MRLSQVRKGGHVVAGRENNTLKALGFVLMGTGGPILNTDNGSTVSGQSDPQ